MTYPCRGACGRRVDVECDLCEGCTFAGPGWDFASPNLPEENARLALGLVEDMEQGLKQVETELIGEFAVVRRRLARRAEQVAALRRVLEGS